MANGRDEGHESVLRLSLDAARGNDKNITSVSAALYKMHCDENGFVLKWKYLSSRWLSSYTSSSSAASSASSASPKQEGA